MKTFKNGKCQKLGTCCREIRICPPKKVGEISYGFNTLTNESEAWRCIKIAKDSNDSIMQRITPKEQTK